MSGRIFSGPDQISAAEDASSIIFGTSPYVESIDNVFSVALDSSLVWRNVAFDGGSARYGANQDGVLHAILSGSISADLVAVTVKVLSGKSIYL